MSRNSPNWAQMSLNKFYGLKKSDMTYVMIIKALYKDGKYNHKKTLLWQIFIKPFGHALWRTPI